MTVDVVSIFTDLQNVLQAGNNSFRNGMHCYFWGRFASFVVSIRAVDLEEDGKFKNSLLAWLQRDPDIDLEHLALKAEHRAQSLSEGRRDNLLIVGYWSNICYAFRHLETQNPKWSVYSADSFLGAIEDFSDTHGSEKLKGELENLSNGILAARMVNEAGEMQKAESIMQWASSSSFGEPLAEFSISPR